MKSALSIEMLSQPIIFITKQGTVKLLDFGVAQWHHRNAKDKELTQPGSMLGTISYMAPEQILSKKVDARADIWSLGAVAFEMFSGVKPFANEGNILTSINAIVNNPLPKIEDYNPMVKPIIKRLLDKTLCKEITGRYNSTIEILKDLDELNTEIRAEQSMSSEKNIHDLEIPSAVGFQALEQGYTEVTERFEDMPMIE